VAASIRLHQLFSAGAQVYRLLTRGRATAWPHLVRDVGVSALALVFSFWSLAGSGYQAVYYGTVVLLLGIPLYIWLKVDRGEYGEGERDDGERAVPRGVRGDGASAPSEEDLGPCPAGSALTRLGP
jgi:hypothetical protein